MTNTEGVQRYADAIMAMIKEDQDTGQVPGEVSSLEELDNCVDIEDYYRQIQLPADNGEAGHLRNAVSAEIRRRLAEAHGGPWHVTWKHPGGQPLDIGRTIGYQTREEAQAVGRSYLAAHGGAFHVHSR